MTTNTIIKWSNLSKSLVTPTLGYKYCLKRWCYPTLNGGENCLRSAQPLFLEIWDFSNSIFFSYFSLSIKMKEQPIFTTLFNCNQEHLRFWICLKKLPHFIKDNKSCVFIKATYTFSTTKRTFGAEFTTLSMSWWPWTSSVRRRKRSGNFSTFFANQMWMRWHWRFRHWRFWHWRFFQKRHWRPRHWRPSDFGGPRHWRPPAEKQLGGEENLCTMGGVWWR